MLGGFGRNIKATPCPCPCLDSLSWEARHNTAQCALRVRTGTPLRFISEGNPKCLPPPPPPNPAPLLGLCSPGLSKGVMKISIDFVSSTCHMLREHWNVWGVQFSMKAQLEFGHLVRNAPTLWPDSCIKATSLHKVFGKEVWDLVSIFLRGAV